MRETFFEKINKYKESTKVAYINNKYLDDKLTYKNLIEYAEKLAYYLEEKLKEDNSPIVVYGHKHPLMPVYFLACV